MKAMVMAGGEGRRLRPLTEKLPKPMVPVLGRPCLDYILALLQDCGIGEIGLTLGYLPQTILHHVGERAGVRSFLEERPLGTAGGVKHGEAFLDEDFLVISGDCMCDFDLARAIAFHYEHKAFATLLLTRVEEPLEYGVVVCEESGAVARFIEKPDWSQVYSDTVNTGIYIFDRRVLEYIPAEGAWDFAKDVFPALLRAKLPVFGYVASGYWCDVGNFSSYMQCNFAMLQGAIKTSLPRLPAQGADCRVAVTARVGRNVILGRGVAIGEGCVLENCILGDGAVLGAHCRLQGCLVCGAAVLEAGVIGTGAVVGEGAVVGAGARLNPGVKLWQNRKVEEGSRVSDSVTDFDWAGLFQKDDLVGDIRRFTAGFCGRLGGACAALRPGARVVLMHDGGSAAQAIAGAVAAGAALSGGRCCALGAGFQSLLCYATVLLQGDCGLFVKTAGERIRLFFCSKEGLSLNRTTQRKLDLAFLGGGGGGGAVSGVPEICAMSGLRALYIVAGTRGRSLNGLRVSICTASPAVQSAAEEMLLQAGGVLDSGGGALHLYPDESGGGLRMDDGAGNYYDNDCCCALGLKAAMEEGAGDSIALSWDTPHALVQMVAEAHKKLLKVLSCPADESDFAGRQQMGTQHFMKDGLFRALLICDYLQKHSCTLREAMESLPRFAVAREVFAVPPGSKGKLMQALLREGELPEDNLSEGVLLRRPQGMVRICPCHTDFFRVAAEANCMEAARELCDWTEEKLKKRTEVFRESGDEG